jgi:hypothetical protein
LVKATIVAVFCQQTEIALAVRHLVLAGCVVGYVSIRDVLDVPDDTVKYLSYLYVCLIVSRNYLAAWPVLSLVVGYLLYVLGKFVDG